MCFCWCVFGYLPVGMHLCVLVRVFVCLYLGGLGMLPPTLDSQTVTVPNSYGVAPVLEPLLLAACVRESVSLSAAVAGHNLT